MLIAEAMLWISQSGTHATCPRVLISKNNANLNYPCTSPVPWSLYPPSECKIHLPWSNTDGRNVKVDYWGEGRTFAGSFVSGCPDCYNINLQSKLVSPGPQSRNCLIPNRVPTKGYNTYDELLTVQYVGDGQVQVSSVMGSPVVAASADYIRRYLSVGGIHYSFNLDSMYISNLDSAFAQSSVPLNSRDGIDSSLRDVSFGNVRYHEITWTNSFNRMRCTNSQRVTYESVANMRDRPWEDCPKLLGRPWPETGYNRIRPRYCVNNVFSGVYARFEFFDENCPIAKYNPSNRQYYKWSLRDIHPETGCDGGYMRYVAYGDYSWSHDEQGNDLQYYTSSDDNWSRTGGCDFGTDWWNDLRLFYNGRYYQVQAFSYWFQPCVGKFYVQC